MRQDISKFTLYCLKGRVETRFWHLKPQRVTACLGKLIVCNECMQARNSIQCSPTHCAWRCLPFTLPCSEIDAFLFPVKPVRSLLRRAASDQKSQGVIVLWVLFQQSYYIAKFKKVRMTALVVLVLSFGCWCAYYDNKPAWNSVEIHSGWGWHIVNNDVFSKI